MYSDDQYEALKDLYNKRNTKDSKEFSTLSDNPDQEEVYGEMLREIDTHSEENEDIED